MRTKQSTTPAVSKPNHPTTITWCSDCCRAGLRFDGDEVDEACRYCGGDVFRRKYATLGRARRAVAERQRLHPAQFSKQIDRNAESREGAAMLAALMTSGIGTARPD